MFEASETSHMEKAASNQTDLKMDHISPEGCQTHAQGKWKGWKHLLKTGNWNFSAGAICEQDDFILSYKNLNLIHCCLITKS